MSKDEKPIPITDDGSECGLIIISDEDCLTEAMTRLFWANAFPFGAGATWTLAESWAPSPKPGEPDGEDESEADSEEDENEDLRPEIEMAGLGCPPAVRIEK